MMQKTWFKLFIWFISSFMFFMASSIIISIYGPPATMQQKMAFMSGMMNAMQNSLMGLSMSISMDHKLMKFISDISSFTVILNIISIAAGDYVRTATRRKKNG
jgi:hypothetical protein